MTPRRARWTLLLLGLLWLVTLVGAPLLGSQELDLGQALAGEGRSGAILWQLRLPRVLLGLFAGAILAGSGCAFQTLFRNPLAEPYTLGVAGGAALGAVAAIAWAGDGFGLSVAMASFLGALGAAGLVLGIGARHGAFDRHTLLLAGVALSLSSSALILFIQYLADPTETFRMVRWLMGGLSVAGYREVLWLAPWAVGLGALLLALRWPLNLLLTGEETAASRGVDVVWLRRLVLAGTSLAVGALVAVAGPLGFVGLIVPHLARRWVGHDHLSLVPAAMLGGGIFLALSDLAARTLLAPAELPVGVLTALAGAPFFLWLLLGKRR